MSVLIRNVQNFSGEFQENVELIYGVPPPPGYSRVLSNRFRNDSIEQGLSKNLTDTLIVGNLHV